MTKAEEDLIIAEQNKSRDEILKAIEQEKCELLGIIQGKDKVINELEQKLEQTEKDLAAYQFNYPKIKELEQENAELKARLQKKINTTTVSDYPYSALKLEEAKEIIRDLLNLPFANNEEVYADVTSHLDRAEQFLNDEVKE